MSLPFMTNLVLYYSYQVWQQSDQNQHWREMEQFNSMIKKPGKMSPVSRLLVTVKLLSVARCFRGAPPNHLNHHNHNRTSTSSYEISFSNNRWLTLSHLSLHHTVIAGVVKTSTPRVNFGVTLTSWTGQWSVVMVTLLVLTVTVMPVSRGWVGGF